MRCEPWCADAQDTALLESNRSGAAVQRLILANGPVSRFSAARGSSLVGRSILVPCAKLRGRWGQSPQGMGVRGKTKTVR